MKASNLGTCIIDRTCLILSINFKCQSETTYFESVKGMYQYQLNTKVFVVFCYSFIYIFVEYTCQHEKYN